MKTTSDETGPPSPWRQRILDYVDAHPARPLKRRALARELSVPHEAYHDFKTVIDKLITDGRLVLGQGRTLHPGEAAGAIIGVLHIDRRGFGFVDAPGRPGVFVPPGHLGDGQHGDTVSARLLDAGRRGGDPRAQVVRVLARSQARWVGALEHAGDRWIVRPQGNGPINIVEVDDPGAKSARAGDLVVVEPLHSAAATGRGRGVIIERLGKASVTRSMILGVVRRYGIADEFPSDVRHEASHAAKRLTEQVIGQREDLRGLLTITIDPVDARDFDDAITLEPLPHGHMRLGVHIADVAFFVPPGSAIDAEARARGTSTYFPGFVVPMLPETLSNGVCSLQEGQPRLTKSAFIEYDARGSVVAARYANSVIRSDCRLTYERVSAALDGKPAGDGVPAMRPEVLNLLRAAEQLARRIRKRRLDAGMISLNLPEMVVRLDADDKVADVGPADTSFSHTIIEMFMVEANEAVCRLLAGRDLPHLRRIHPPPDPDALTRLSTQLAALGHATLRGSSPADIQHLLDSARDKPEEAPVNYLVLRSMAQAVYSPRREGHFALASEDYCHFTSPIRRYPDLTIHRLLDLHLTGRLATRQARAEVDSEAELVQLGFQCSASERRSQDAERDAKTLLVLEFMKSKVGEIFDGIVSGVSAYGVFVRVFPFLSEGLIRNADLPDDDWLYSRDNGCVIGRRSRRIIAIGQRTRVQVAGISDFRQEMELVPAAAMGVAPKHAAQHAESAARSRGKGRRMKEPERRKNSRRRRW